MLHPFPSVEIHRKLADLTTPHHTLHQSLYTQIATENLYPIPLIPHRYLTIVKKKKD